MAAGRIFGCSALTTLSLLLRVVYFGQNITKLSDNNLSSPTKVFYYAYDGNPDVFLLQKFDHAACDVRHLGSCFHRPSRNFGKSTLTITAIVMPVFISIISRSVVMYIRTLDPRLLIKIQSKIRIRPNRRKHLYGSVLVLSV